MNLVWIMGAILGLGSVGGMVWWWRGRVSVPVTALDEPPMSVPKPRPGPVATDTLRQFVPFTHLSEEELLAFACQCQPESYSAGSRVFAPEDVPDTEFFLLEGTVTIETPGHLACQVTADTRAASQPLSRGTAGETTAWAATSVKVLPITRDLLQAYKREAEQRETRLPVVPDLMRQPVPPVLEKSSLFYVFCRTFQDGRVELPTLPAVALKLSQALREDVDFAGAARIVQLDPAFAAKLIQVANSPLYAGTSRVSTCQGAIMRLGLIPTRNLIFSLSLKNLFTTRHPEIRELLQQVWQRSLNLSVLAAVLATHTQRVDPDAALLGGLLVNIGIIPFLSFAEKFPAGYHAKDELEAAFPIIQGPVGEFLLARWEFPADYIELPILAEHWQYSAGDRLDLGDIVRLATWHSYLGTPRQADLPLITDLPAYAKLDDGTLTPEASLHILHEAKDKIAELRQILS